MDDCLQYNCGIITTQELENYKGPNKNPICDDEPPCGKCIKCKLKIKRDSMSQPELLTSLTHFGYSQEEKILCAKIRTENGEIIWRRRAFPFVPEEYKSDSFNTFSTFAEFYKWSQTHQMEI